jgi:hypothetical protein
MSDRAKAVWVAFHDETEKAMAPDGALEALRDVAGKAAENAARVAGVLSIVADPDASIIDADAMVAACELMTWYLAEGLRLTGLHRLSAELRNAMRLLEWLQSKRKREITRTEIMQFGPAPLRTKAAADAAFAVLEEHGYVTRHGEVRRSRWTVEGEAE